MLHAETFDPVPQVVLPFSGEDPGFGVATPAQSPGIEIAVYGLGVSVNPQNLYDYNVLMLQRFARLVWGIEVSPASWFRHTRPYTYWSMSLSVAKTRLGSFGAACDLWPCGVPLPQRLAGGWLMGSNEHGQLFLAYVSRAGQSDRDPLSAVADTDPYRIRRVQPRQLLTHGFLVPRFVVKPWLEPAQEPAQKEAEQAAPQEAELHAREQEQEQEHEEYEQEAPAAWLNPVQRRSRRPGAPSAWQMGASA